MSGTVKANTGSAVTAVSAASTRRVPQTVLDCFWTLSETDKELRVTSISKIIDVIEKQEQDEARDTLAYCVERVIKGVSSSRKQSRRGYATLLTELLHSKNVSVGDCISLAEKHFGPFEESDASSTIAWTFLLACIFESGVLVNEVDKRFMKTFVSTVTYFGRQKKFVELFLCELLLDALRYNTIGVELLEILKSCVTEGETSFDLFVTFAINDRTKTKKNNLKETLDLNKVAKVISETTAFLPKVHPLCREACNYYILNGNFSEFWLSCVNEKLFRIGAKEKIALGFALIDIVLPHLNKLDPQVTFSNCFLKVLMPILSNSKHALHNSAVTLMNSLTETLRKTENAELQVKVSQCFINSPGTILFDTISKTKFLTNVVSAFKKEAVVQWFQVLRAKVIEMENVHNTDSLRICCVQQIASLVKLPAVAHDVMWQIDILSFLYVYSYFEIRTESATFKKFKNEITEKLRGTFRDCFLKSVEFVCLSLTTKQKTHETDVLNSMVKIVNKSLSNENLMFLLPQKVSQMWESAVCRLKKLKRNINNESTFQFSVVYILFCFHLFEEPEETTDILNELTECIERSSSSDDKSRLHSKDQEPHWADVLADLIISMLPKASFSLRKILVSTFQLICGCITEEVIKQLECALLCQEINSDGALSEEESKEKSDTDSDSDSDNEMKSDENDKNDTEDEETDNMNVDEEFRLQVASALGPAAHCSDTEESEVYLSDSEMFQVDEALSEAFRSRVKSTKLIKQKQLTQLEFKLKCLDLVNVMVTQKNPSLSQLLRIAKLMLDVLYNMASNKSCVTLVQKSLHNIRNIAAVKRYNVCKTDEQKDVIVILAKQCLLVCNKVVESKLQHSLAIFFSWTVTVGKQVMNDNNWFIALVMDALKNNFEKRNSCISKGFFEEIIKSHSEISIPIIMFNQNIAFDGQLRMFKRMDALSMLVCCLKSLNSETAEVSLKDAIVKMYRNAIEIMASNITSKKMMYVSFLLEAILQLQLHLLNPSFAERMSSHDSKLIESSKEQLLINLTKLDRKIRRRLTANGKKSFKILKKKVKLILL